MGHCSHTLIYKYTSYKVLSGIFLVWDTALTHTQPPYPPFLPANNRYNCPIISFLFILIGNICLIYNEILFSMKKCIFYIYNTQYKQHSTSSRMIPPLSFSDQLIFFILFSDIHLKSSIMEQCNGTSKILPKCKRINDWHWTGPIQPATSTNNRYKCPITSLLSLSFKI